MLDHGKLSVLGEIRVPVGGIRNGKERKPFAISDASLNERGPLGFEGRPQQLHLRLLGRFAALSAVAGKARAHDVVPTRRPAAGTRDHVIQVQLVARKSAAAILAGTFVTNIDIVTAEPNLSVRYPIIPNEENHARDANRLIHQPDRLIMEAHGEIGPALEIISLVLLVDNARDAKVEEIESTADRSDVNGYERPIQHQDLCVEYDNARAHRTPTPARSMLILSDTKIPSLAKL